MRGCLFYDSKPPKRKLRILLRLLGLLFGMFGLSGVFGTRKKDMKKEPA